LWIRWAYISDICYSGLEVISVILSNISQQLLSLAIPLSNAYGLLLLTLLMGYGLVEVPRQLWNYSKPDFVLSYIEKNISSVKEACIDTEAQVHEYSRVFFR